MEKIFNRTNLWLILLGFILIATGLRLEIIQAFASHVPYWDDYTIGGLVHAYQAGTMTFNDLIVDSNEHRLVINRLLSLLYFELNQNQWDQKIPMVGNSILWAFSGALLLKIVCQNMAAKPAIAASLIIALFWLFPIAVVNTIWGVQTHTYTLILFSVLGCWWVTKPVFSAKWWAGLICLGIAPLTLAGGTFVSFSVFGVVFLFAAKDRFNDRTQLITILAVLLIGIFGLFTILVQSGGAATSSHFTILNALKTFSKTLSWPLSTSYWASIIFLSPIMLLLIQALREKTQPSRLVVFTLSLFGFIFLLALAVAYARASGYGPARRYFDFLALGPVASFIALTQLRIGLSKARTILFPLLMSAWIVAVSISVPYIIKTFTYTVEDRTYLKPIHEKLVMSYLNTKDISHLENKPFRHAPFPRGNQLGDILTDFNNEDILHYKLQTPKPLTPDTRVPEIERKLSPFIVNGTVTPSTKQHGVKPFEQDVYGSYHRGQGGVLAQGQFVSQEFHHTRDYIAIPVTGYFGYPDLTLSLRHFPSGKEYEVTLSKDINSNNAEKWTYVINKLPKGYYQLVARDDNPKLWFGFATPKSVGRLSYRVEYLIKHSYIVWLLGIALLLFGLRSALIQLFDTLDAQLEARSES